MFKRSLLAASVTVLSISMVNAAPFMPIDARGLAMGNTGVASAKRAHAPAYNPSLLSQANKNDDFSIIFPQVGAWLSDEKAIIDPAKDINDDIFPRFEKIVEKNEDGNLQDNLKGLLSSSDELQGLTITVTTTSPDKATLTQELGELKATNQSIQNNINAINNNLNKLDSTINDLTNSLNKISDNPISARLGLAGTVAVPSKKFAVAVSVGGTANISARITLSDHDTGLLNAYVPAAKEYIDAAGKITTDIDKALKDIDNATTSSELTAAANNIQGLINGTSSSSSSSLQDRAAGLSNFTTAEVDALNGNPIIKNGQLSDQASDPELSSTAEVIGIGVADVGVTFSREFDIKGEAIAIGITPKIQKIFTFHYGNEFTNFDDFDSDDIDEYRKDYTAFNLDLGASYRFGANKNWMAGAVIKNLLGGTYKYLGTDVLSGGEVKLNPQVRGGIAYQGKLLNAAFDLDLLKNDPIAYEAPTQYASFGVELDAWGWAQLRAGYRTNLKQSGMSVVSGGIGLSPGDMFVIDIAGLVNPSDVKKEAGAVIEMGLNF